MEYAYLSRMATISSVREIKKRTKRQRGKALGEACGADSGEDDI